LSKENLFPLPSKFENKLARNTKRWSKGCKGKAPHFTLSSLDVYQ